MTQRVRDQAEELAEWYQNRVRPFLVREEPGRLDEFDADLERLCDVKCSLNEELSVCFLGASGVGKSTLINALVAGGEMVLPSGGIGPMTAQALTVRQGRDRGFKVQYHPPGLLNNVLFALEGSIDAGRKLAAKSLVASPLRSEASEGVDDESGMKLQEMERNEDSFYVKQARLMVTGGQDGTEGSEYLADCLRTVMGQARKWGTVPRPEDEPRLQRIQKALALAQTGADYRHPRASDDPGGFHSDLKDHTSGFLAPLIQQMEVTWNSESLPDHITLTDLPGVGVAYDVHRNVTHKWIREKARAVVLVVGNRGVMEADAHLLHSSGFLNRLLYSVQNPAEDPVQLMIVVVRVDESAKTRWDEERALGKRDKKKPEYFAETCEKADKVIRSQMRQQLEQVWASGGVGEGQTQVIDHILKRLEIHPLSAIQYRRLLVGDEEDKPFLDDLEQSNVPGLLESLRKKADERHDAEAARIQSACDDFAGKILKGLEVIRAQWEAEDRVNQEAERLREELLGFLRPLREEFLQRRGEFRKFLSATLPEVVEKLVAKAGKQSRRELSAYLGELRRAGHVKTIQAALKRGGVFREGARPIDLPKDFALRFEVPIAEVWGREVLQRIRSETTQYAKVCVQIVEEAVTRARRNGAPLYTRLVEAQRDAMKADLKHLESIGGAMANELRDQVNRRLVKEVEGPIRDRCKQFVESKEHTGAGAKDRMIVFFHDLADEVTATASEKAVEVLVKCSRDVEKEILAVLLKHQDPMKSAGEAIVASDEQTRGRGDAERRRQVVEAVVSILADAPGGLVQAEVAGAVA